jgi:flagellar biosynthesis/type III secretory pathway protein FliH
MDKTQERTARVWQSADFLRADMGGHAFEPKSWRGSKAPEFQVPGFGTPESAQPDQESMAPLALAPPDAAPQLPAAEVLLPPPAGQFTEDDIEQARLQAYEQGRQQGLREAGEQARSEAAHWQQSAGQRLASLERGVQDLLQSPERLHEPLKRLAVHLAEQLVIGELAVSPQAIERLVQRCVEELDAQRGVPVLIELHPDDLAPMQEALRAMGPEASESADTSKHAPPWVLQGNAALLPGSVRASANDAVVSDLIEHRLDALARQLLVSPTQVRQQSALRSDRLAARRADVSQVLDAQPRMADAPRSNRFSPVIDADVSPVDEPGPIEGEGDHE